MDVTTDGTTTGVITFVQGQEETTTTTKSSEEIKEGTDKIPGLVTTIRICRGIKGNTIIIQDRHNNPDQINNNSHSNNYSRTFHLNNLLLPNKYSHKI